MSSTATRALYHLNQLRPAIVDSRDDELTEETSLIPTARLEALEDLEKAVKPVKEELMGLLGAKVIEGVFDRGVEWGRLLKSLAALDQQKGIGG